MPSEEGRHIFILPNHSVCGKILSGFYKRMSVMGRRLPEWLKVRIPKGSKIERVRSVIRALRLNTVCDEAKCPNRAECYGKGTATFMILGDICTRNCRFCAVEHGLPAPPDEKEPERIAKAVKELNLRHAVITSVTRDDLPDGGAGQFAATVSAIRVSSEDISVEILTPDFGGDERAFKTALSVTPDIFNHNIETVKRLYPTVRPEADYSRSLSILRLAKRLHPQMITKSGLMVGLGEDYDEVIETLYDLRSVECDVVTVGQYLKPTEGRTEVIRYWHPSEFEKLRKDAESMGFLAVYAAPLVRSSFNAASILARIRGTDL